MTGPYFTKPTLRNVLCNIPLTLSFIALMVISRVVSTPVEIALLLCLPVFAASAFVSRSYDVLHGKVTFITFPV
ncbi:MAG: hypothetical protein LUC49_05805 [Prevotella sp.]|nr:hypothetical protein [Prevotella sp.]